MHDVVLDDFLRAAGHGNGLTVQEVQHAGGDFEAAGRFAIWRVPGADIDTVGDDLNGRARRLAFQDFRQLAVCLDLHPLLRGVGLVAPLRAAVLVLVAFALGKVHGDFRCRGYAASPFAVFHAVRVRDADDLLARDFGVALCDQVPGEVCGEHSPELRVPFGLR